MGVYIPNVKRPHCCRMCPNPVCIPDGINTMDMLDFIMRRRHEHPDSRADDCPIEEVDDIAFGLYKAYIDGIEPSETPKEIVRCKECKRSLTYTMNSNLPISRWCLRFSAPVAVEDDDYCSYGERRMIWE